MRRQRVYGYYEPNPMPNWTGYVAAAVAIVAGLVPFIAPFFVR